MNRITIAVDIAGRPTRGTEGSPRVTAAAVVLPTANLDNVRSAIPADLPKWRSIDEATAAHVVDILRVHSVAISASTVNRDTAAWKQAIQDEEVLQSAFVKPAGWAKLPVLLVYELLGRSAYRGLAHFLSRYRGQGIVNQDGLSLIECNVICDQEISGEENIEVFKSFWDTSQIPVKSLASFGFKVTHPNVRLDSDDNEPLLRLADVAAGLIHSAHIPDPGRVSMPISHTMVKKLLMPLLSSRLLSVDAFDYDASYDQIFGHVMQAARDT
jgi:hypothetical protein